MAASFLWLFWKDASKAMLGLGGTVRGPMGPKENHMIAVGLPYKMPRTPLFPKLIMWVVL